VYIKKENRFKSIKSNQIARMKRAKKAIKDATARPTTSDRNCNYNV